MSTNEYGTEKTNGLGHTIERAASLIDDRIHWGADAVSNFARQTADQMGRASDYVQQKVRRQAEQVGELANDHPVYTMLAVGLIGIGVGFLLRGGIRGRRTTTETP